MKSEQGDPIPLWERSEPAVRPAPSPLSRDNIVRSAIALADSEGLSAVSLRKVASSLDAGAMRLYRYLSTKDELLDLMADAVYGEIVSEGPIVGEWRDTLRTIANRIRSACREHPWFIELLGGRPHMGPNALAMLEASFAALNDSPGFDTVDASMQAIRTVNAYVIGAVQAENSDLKNSMSKADWQKVWWPYLERLIATGNFPMLAKIIRDASHPSPDIIFDTGLETVLDGLGSQISR
ncbi:TetR/AcrR family transcriptional regulator [Martelella soudanensis]|uniref:TetR/AcrR family transcriptional regulator n=1 Tax=unclassified Martelella TaxID=2629616 RepID=UPI0015E00446|nr:MULTISPECIES: TetR/AcrR family transcriptional regulator [unclassified Martelella]